EAIAFHIVPRQVQTHWPLILWANPVLPVVSRCKIAAWPTQNGNAQLLNGFHHVLAIAICVRKRTPFFVDATIDHPSEMLAEVSKQVRIDFTDLAIDVDLNSG